MYEQDGRRVVGAMAHVYASVYLPYICLSVSRVCCVCLLSLGPAIWLYGCMAICPWLYFRR